MDRSYPIWYKGTVILLGITLFFTALYFGRFLFMPLAYSALIAMLLEPVSEWMQRWKINKVVAILLSMILLFIVLAGIISLLSIQLIQFADRLSEANERIQAIGSDWLQFFQSRFNISPERQIDYLQKGFSTLVSKSGEYASTAFGATTSVFTTLTLIPVFVFFMMYYKKMYLKFLHLITKGRSKITIDSMVSEIQKVTQNYIIGLITVVGILSVLNAFGLWLVGLENVLFFAVFAAVWAVIPYIGVIIGSLPAVIFAFLFSGSVFQPVAVIGVFAVVQFLEGHFITPNITGSRVSINPFMAILALLIGGEVWGVSGMILFVPFLGIIKSIFDRIDGLQPVGYLFGNSSEYQPKKENPQS